MSTDRIPPGGHAATNHIRQAATLLFLGDHTSPDDPGYVGVVRGVLERFHPELGIRLVSAGGRGQTASALRSEALMQIITSSGPQWVVLGVGLADAMLEPAARRLALEDAERRRRADEGLDAAFGPVYHADAGEDEPVGDAGPPAEPEMPHLSVFRRDLGAVVVALRQAGVRPALLTIATHGPDRALRVNAVTRAYSRAIREVARAEDAPLVDVEQAFRNLFDRAADYKQTVSLTAPDGRLNAQGQTLIARTFLATFGLLPGTGSRHRP